MAPGLKALPDQRAEQRGLFDRLGAAGPKRLLAIDALAGRGMITAGLLSVLEEQLAKRAGRTKVRLCDYFDLIGGVSTGAVAAAILARGGSAQDVAEVARAIAPQTGAKEPKTAAGRRSRIDLARADAVMRARFGDARFDQAGFETGFAAFAVRADNGALQIFSPMSPATPAAMLVRDGLAASLGGPSPGEPAMIAFESENGAFEDVGFVDPAAAGFVTPALRLLQAAAGGALRLHWPPGDAVMCLISVGGGAWRSGLLGVSGGKAEEAAFARAAAVMSASAQNAAFEAVSAIQAIADAPRPWGVEGGGQDSGAAGDVRLTVVPVTHFHRLDAWLDAAALAELGLTYSPAEIAALREAASDAPAEMARMHEIGRRAAGASFGAGVAEIEAQILPPKFDPPGFLERAQGPPRIRLQALSRAFEKRDSEG
jgi:uncharacterized protein